MGSIWKKGNGTLGKMCDFTGIKRSRGGAGVALGKDARENFKRAEERKGLTVTA